MERMAPLLLGKRGRRDPLLNEALQREAQAELESRILQGRPPPEEWPADARSAPEHQDRRRRRQPVSSAFRLRTGRFDVAAAARAAGASEPTARTRSLDGRRDPVDAKNAGVSPEIGHDLVGNRLVGGQHHQRRLS